MIDRVHRDAAHRRAHATPAHPSGFADRLEGMFFVTDLADRRAAVDVHTTDFTRAQAQLGVFAGAREQRAFTRHHFNAADRRADRNVSEWQRIADFDGGFGT